MTDAKPDAVRVDSIKKKITLDLDEIRADLKTDVIKELEDTIKFNRIIIEDRIKGKLIQIEYIKGDPQELINHAAGIDEHFFPQTNNRGRGYIG